MTKTTDFNPPMAISRRNFGQLLGVSGAMAMLPWKLEAQAGGDTLVFALICATSGAALGADMTLLPAAFARRLETISPGATEGFGLWAFVSKFTLAFAAVTLLPVLDAVGFVPGAENTISSLNALTLAYAGVPIFLKLVAIGLLCVTPLTED